MLLPSTASAGAAPAAAADPYGVALLKELNRVRARHGLPAVRADARMDGGARAHSRDMATRRYFAHGAWTSRVSAASRRARSVGEVIGWLAQNDPRTEAAAIVRAWLGSPTHRHVMLTGGFRRVGIGRATGTVQGFSASLYTLDFATAR